MRYVILGGTGTLGREVTRQILERRDGSEIVCFSRDELKQKELLRDFQTPEMLRCRLGDIRNISSLARTLEPGDHVFHVAALKHVDTCELNIEECIATNLIGTQNVADVAKALGVARVVFSSTDKAVDPINAYGMCKGISEKLLLSRNSECGPKFTVYRWGNVLGSRGSIVHGFANAIKTTGKVPITNLAMTRFWIRIEDAVKFMLDTYQGTNPGPLIPPMKAAQVTKLANAVANSIGHPLYTISDVGIRPGEKIHEQIVSKHISPEANSRQSDQYSLEELESMVRPILGGVA